MNNYMLDYRYKHDPSTGNITWIETSLTGKPLLTTPQLNKGTAFSEEERIAFGLLGKLPIRIETLEEQVERAYKQYNTYQSKLQKHIYLYSLHDKNQILFYRLVQEHLAEMLPVIYTPIVGTAVKEFSKEFRQARGLYLDYLHRDQLEKVLDNRSNPEVELIVVTDGEGVLGIGDQGIGGMDIPIAKLMVYSLCGGINPLSTLPIQLDVGTNNPTLLADPLYLGWRHERIRGQAYDDFIENFVLTVKQKFPNAFLHWEDFGRATARYNLERFRNTLCSFNDDIQGTAIVTLAALLSAVKSNQDQISNQRIVIFGAGTAGTGICDQICAAMVQEGLSWDEARQHFWLIDKRGLLLQSHSDLTSGQMPYARTQSEVITWSKNAEGNINLLTTLEHVKPNILIGCSGMPGAFNQACIRVMAQHNANPIIFTLSNPTENCEAHPKDILAWSDNRALIATGSPFEDIQIHGKPIHITQCNNALVFPGIGLGVLAVKASRLTDNMLWAACRALCEHVPIRYSPLDPLLPDLQHARSISRFIAIAVARAACSDGVANTSGKESIENLIQQKIWEPRYLPLKKYDANMPL